MKNMLKINSSLIMVLLITAVIVAVNCVPTSVLADAKESKAKQITTNEQQNDASHNVNADNSKPQKRGVNPLLYPDAEFKPDYSYSSNPLPTGVWEDINSPSIYPELLQGSYDLNHDKSYENLQSLLNQQYYTEPIALPVEYPYRYYGYGDRKKRSSASQKLKASRVSRLKRNPGKMSAADMFSLLALMEAQQEAQQFPDLFQMAQEGQNDVRPYSANSVYQDIPLSAFEQIGRGANEDNGEWMNTWTEPAVEYYGVPIAVEPMNMKYPKLNLAAHKRFMVSKKKRDIRDDCRKSKLGEYMCLMKLYEREEPQYRNILQTLP